MQHLLPKHMGIGRVTRPLVSFRSQTTAPPTALKPTLSPLFQDLQDQVQLHPPDYNRITTLLKSAAKSTQSKHDRQHLVSTILPHLVEKSFMHNGIKSDVSQIAEIAGLWKSVHRMNLDVEYSNFLRKVVRWMVYVCIEVQLAEKTKPVLEETHKTALSHVKEILRHMPSRDSKSTGNMLWKKVLQT